MNFSMKRGTDEVFANHITNVCQSMEETRRSFNMSQQYTVGSSKALIDVNQYLLKYHLIAINIESFAMLYDKNIQNDGLDTKKIQPYFNIQLGIFNSGNGLDSLVQTYTAGAVTFMTELPTTSTFQMNIISGFDNHLYIHDNGSATITDQLLENW